jgi:glycosyltransferase involved in cell wall biosynthesis
MRILIASESQYIAFHGQAIFTRNLSEGLARRGHDVSVLTLSERGRPYQEQVAGVQVEAVRSLSLGLLHPDVYASAFPEKRVRQVVRQFRPDIIHIQDHYPLCRSAVRNAKRYGIKVVGTNHFMPENLAAYVPVISRIKPLYNWILWHWMLDLYNRLDAAAVPSKSGADLLRRQGIRPPVFPISCGVDVRHFHPIANLDRAAWRARYGLDPDRKIIFFVGRVDREKRLDVLLKAVRLMDRRDLQCVIAGNGAALQGLKALAQELELGGNVLFTGFVPNEDLPSLLGSVDIFAMPSEAELLSIATLEAMACGLPVLAARAMALPELVSENVNGFLFNPGDATDAASCLGLLADHPERWKEMGQASLDKVQQHSLDRGLSQYEDLYRSVLNGPHGGEEAI